MTIGTSSNPVRLVAGPEKHSLRHAPTARTAGLPHPTEYTADQALAYVASAPELRSPAERVLARELEVLRAAYGASQQHQSDQAAELLTLHVDASASDEAARDGGNALTVAYAAIGEVTRRWEQHDPQTVAGRRVRLGVGKWCGSSFVAALDELCGIV